MPDRAAEPIKVPFFNLSTLLFFVNYKYCNSPISSVKCKPHREYCWKKTAHRWELSPPWFCSAGRCIPHIPLSAPVPKKNDQSILSAAGPDGLPPGSPASECGACTPDFHSRRVGGCVRRGRADYGRERAGPDGLPPGSPASSLTYLCPGFRF